jgi:hypothetical protein
MASANCCQVVAARLSRSEAPACCHSTHQLLAKNQEYSTNIAPLYGGQSGSGVYRCRIRVPLTAMGRTSLFRGEGGKVWNPAFASGSRRRERQMLPHSEHIQIAGDLTLRVLMVPPVPQMIGVGPLPVMRPIFRAALYFVRLVRKVGRPNLEQRYIVWVYGRLRPLAAFSCKCA